MSIARDIVPPNFATRALALLCVGALVTALAATLATGTAQAQERRWDVTEKPFDQASQAEQIGRNVRDGMVGLVDSLGQGLLSAAAIGSPWGGLVARKVATFGGDVIGLVDDNDVTEHVFKGILSRQLLRFGTGGGGFAAGLGVIHDTKFDAPDLQVSDYTGDQMFHTDAYMKPSALATLGAVVASDVVARPLGNLLTIFGFRSVGEDLDEWGMDLIEQALAVEFL